jgi:two-component system nitrate/nitrite response regulator NarL
MASCPIVSLSPIRVLIANGQSLLRDGLRGLLNSGGFLVVGETADGESVAALAEETQADVILLDLAMPRHDGIEILRELAALDLPSRTLVLASSASREQVVRAMKLGAFGVIPMESTTRRLFEGIRSVMEGQYWIGHEHVSDLVRALRNYNRLDEISRPKQFGLTPRELEVVSLVAAGYSNPEISQTFSISLQTVKHHISNIFNKLGVSNRLEMAMFAVNHRLIIANS